MADNLRISAKIVADGSAFALELRGAKRELDALGRAGREAGESIDRGMSASRRGVESISRQLAGLRTTVLGAAGLASLGSVAQQAVQAADSLTNLSARLNLVTGSAERTTGVQARLFSIAQSSRVGYVELGNTYAQVARSSAELGISQDRLLTVTQALSQAMTISGGSAASQQAAMVQLSQGLASGTLRGEELNSILEQTPRVAQAIADGMGVSVGQLRKLGEEGALTARAVVEALEASAPALAREFDKIRPTVSGAFQVLRNSATDFVGEVDRSTGASQKLAEALIGLASALTEAKSGVAGFVDAAKPLAEMALWAAGGVALARALQSIAAVGVGSGMMALLGRIGGFLGGAAGAAGAVGGLVVGAATQDDAAQRTIQAQINAALARNGGAETGEVKYLRERLAQLNGGRTAAEELGLPPLDGYREDIGADEAALGMPLISADRARRQYLTDQANQSRAQRAAAERRVAVEQFAQLAAQEQGVGGREAALEELRAGLRQRLANIDDKYKPEGARGAAADRKQALAVQLAEERAAVEQGERLKLQALESLGRQGLRTDEQIVTERRAIQLESIAEQIRVAEQARAAAGTDASEKARATATINGLVRERLAVEQQATEKLAELAAQRAAAIEQEARGYRQARFDDTRQIRDSIQAMEDENRARRIAIATGREEAETLREIRLERMEAELAIDERPDPDKIARLEALREELALLRERREVLEGDRASGSQAGRAAKDMQEREAEISRSLTDALYRGFESGKDLAQNFADTLKNTFGTMVLRPLIEPVFKPFSKALNDVGEQVMGSLLGGLGELFGGGGSPILAGDSPLAATGADIRARRAKGGPVGAFGTYMVGEEGPELLRLGKTSGWIEPNAATAARMGMAGAGGAPQFVINNTLSGEVSRGDVANSMNFMAAEVERRLTEAWQRNHPAYRR